MPAARFGALLDGLWHQGAREGQHRGSENISEIKSLDTRCSCSLTAWQDGLRRRERSTKGIADCVKGRERWILARCIVRSARPRGREEGECKDNAERRSLGPPKRFTSRVKLKLTFNEHQWTGRSKGEEMSEPFLKTVSQTTYCRLLGEGYVAHKL